MDFAPVNGEELGGANKGYNALLAGGIALVLTTFSAASTIDAVLTGGMETNPELSAYVSVGLRGGTDSNCWIDGKRIIWTVLRGNIHGDAFISSGLRKCDGLNGGYLQAITEDAIYKTSICGGSLGGATTNGLYSSSVFGGIHYTAGILVNGIHSNSAFDGAITDDLLHRVNYDVVPVGVQGVVATVDGAITPPAGTGPFTSNTVAPVTYAQGVISAISATKTVGETTTNALIIAPELTPRVSLDLVQPPLYNTPRPAVSVSLDSSGIEITGGIRSSVDCAGSGCMQISDMGGEYIIGCGLTGGIMTMPIFTSGRRLSAQLWDGPNNDSIVGSDVTMSVFNNGGLASNDDLATPIWVISPVVHSGVYSAYSAGAGRVIDYVGPEFGIYSNASDGGVIERDCLPSGGVYSDQSEGSEFVVDARPYGGLYSDGSAGFELTIDFYISGGVDSDSQVLFEFDPATRRSRVLDGGVSQYEMLGGNPIFDSILSGQVISDTDSFDSVNSLMIDAILSGAVDSVGYQHSAELKVDIELKDGIDQYEMFDAELYAEVIISGGVESPQEAGYNILLEPPLVDGIFSTNRVSSVLYTNPVLTAGIASTSSTGGDIAQGFKDPLLNTSALAIRSATQVLSIVHPYEDI